MTVTIRPLRGADEITSGLRTFFRTMVGLAVPQDFSAADIVEEGRFWGAFDGPDLVGTADASSGWLVVPGGARLPHAAVTHVGVLPTHRRRGIASDLVVRQLRDAADRGEVVASLRASEGGIYERFGYGVATWQRRLQVRTSAVQLRPTGDPTGAVRIVDADVKTAELSAIYEQATWTGAVHRSPGWWRTRELQRGASSDNNYVVIHSTAGVDDGYLIYRPENTATWFTDTERTITVTDFVAVSAAARTGLWRHLLALDLVTRVIVAAARTDDPLPHQVLNPRAVELGPERDETWLRLVNVLAALQGRAFGPGVVTIGVDDDVLPHNCGSYRIADGKVTATDDPPEVVVTAAALATTYLGATAWRTLAAAGRVAAPASGPVSDAVLARLDQIFGTATAPFAGTSF